MPQPTDKNAVESTEVEEELPELELTITNDSTPSRCYALVEGIEHIASASSLTLPPIKDIASGCGLEFTSFEHTGGISDLDFPRLEDFVVPSQAGVDAHDPCLNFALRFVWYVLEAQWNEDSNSPYFFQLLEKLADASRDRKFFICWVDSD